jgi:hypothetical protein
LSRKNLKSHVNGSSQKLRTNSQGSRESVRIKRSCSFGLNSSSLRCNSWKTSPDSSSKCTTKVTRQWAHPPPWYDWIYCSI